MSSTCGRDLMKQIKRGKGSYLYKSLVVGRVRNKKQRRNRELTPWFCVELKTQRGPSILICIGKEFYVLW